MSKVGIMRRAKSGKINITKYTKFAEVRTAARLNDSLFEEPVTLEYQVGSGIHVPSVDNTIYNKTRRA